MRRLLAGRKGEENTNSIMEREAILSAKGKGGGGKGAWVNFLLNWRRGNLLKGGAQIHKVKRGNK